MTPFKGLQFALRVAGGGQRTKLYGVNSGGFPRWCNWFFGNRHGWWLNGRVLRKKILPEGQLGMFNHIVPFLSFCERWLPTPLGQSLVAVARK